MAAFPANADDLRIDHLAEIASRDEPEQAGTPKSVRLSGRMEQLLTYIQQCTHARHTAPISRIFRDALCARAAMLLPSTSGHSPIIRISFVDKHGTYIDKPLSEYLGFDIKGENQGLSNNLPIYDWKARLNQYLVTHSVPVRVNGIMNVTPRIEEQAYQTPTDMLDEVEASRAYLAELGAPNDGVAVIEDSVNWLAMPHSIPVRAMDYATLLVLRNRSKGTGSPPKVPSANVVIFSESERAIIVQKRGRGVMAGTTGDGVLHTFGGSYCARLENSRHLHDHGDLLRTARRELLEESNISFTLETTPTFLHAEETDSGFTQWIIMGRGITPYEYHNIVFFENDPEGTAISIGFDDLEESLLQMNWHHSGRTHVLSWLALGAPGTRTPASFNGRPARDVFDSIVG